MKARVDHELDDRPDLRVELLTIVGESLLSLQDTTGAGQVLGQAVRDGTASLGASHPQTLHARVLMTPVLRFRGRTKELRAELDALLPVLRANHANHANYSNYTNRTAYAEDLVITLKNQAHLEIDDGHYPAAEAAARESADLAVRTLGRRHPETVATSLILAYAQQFTRPPEEALQAAEQAYRLARDVFAESPKHPRVIEGRLLVGRALGLAGELARSIEQLSQAVSDASTAFGLSSRMVGFYSEPLARFQTDAGEIDAAIDSSQRAVAIVSGHSQADSFRTAVALHARGAALLAARRLDDALPDLAGATAILQERERFPLTNEFRRTFQTDYALALALAGRSADAEPLVAPFVSSSRPLYVMGVIKRRTHDYRAALGFQQRALTVLPGGKSTAIDRMRALTEVELNLEALREREQAIAFLREALTISERVQTHLSPAREEILIALNRASASLSRLRN